MSGYPSPSSVVEIAPAHNPEGEPPTAITQSGAGNSLGMASEESWAFAMAGAVTAAVSATAVVARNAPTEAVGRGVIRRVEPVVSTRSSSHRGQRQTIVSEDSAVTDRHVERRGRARNENVFDTCL